MTTTFLNAEQATIWHTLKQKHIDRYNLIAAKHSTLLPSKFKDSKINQKHKEIFYKIRYEFCFFLLNYAKITETEKNKISDLFSVFTQKLYAVRL